MDENIETIIQRASAGCFELKNAIMKKLIARMAENIIDIQGGNNNTQLGQHINGIKFVNNFIFQH